MQERFQVEFQNCILKEVVMILFAGQEVENWTGFQGQDGGFEVAAGGTATSDQHAGADAGNSARRTKQKRSPPCTVTQNPTLTLIIVELLVIEQIISTQQWQILYRGFCESQTHLFCLPLAFHKLENQSTRDVLTVVLESGIKFE